MGQDGRILQEHGILLSRTAGDWKGTKTQVQPQDRQRLAGTETGVAESAERGGAQSCCLLYCHLGSLPLNPWVYELYLGAPAVAMPMPFPSLRALGQVLGPWSLWPLQEPGAAPRTLCWARRSQHNIHRSYTSLTLRHRLKSRLSLLPTVNY